MIGVNFSSKSRNIWGWQASLYSPTGDLIRKLNTVNDALGNPLRFFITAGVGSEKFIEAAKKYNENVQFEKEAEASREKDGYDRSHDRDSWDRDY